MISIQYAGLWIRFKAFLCDSLLVLFCSIIIFASLGLGVDALNVKLGDSIDLIIMIIWLSFYWLYFALMESSSIQATLGKKQVGIIVADLQGCKISFLRASVRLWAKLIIFVFLMFTIFYIMIPSPFKPPQGVFDSVFVYIPLLFVGFVCGIFVMFTPKKQAPHDLIARCIVVRGRGHSG